MAPLDARRFGVNPEELSRKLAAFLVNSDTLFLPHHARTLIDSRTLTKDELGYLVAVATVSMVKEGTKPA